MPHTLTPYFGLIRKLLRQSCLKWTRVNSSNCRSLFTKRFRCTALICTAFLWLFLFIHFIFTIWHFAMKLLLLLISDCEISHRRQKVNWLELSVQIKLKAFDKVIHLIRSNYNCIFRLIERIQMIVNLKGRRCYHKIEQNSIQTNCDFNERPRICSHHSNHSKTA